MLANDGAGRWDFAFMGCSGLNDAFIDSIRHMPDDTRFRTQNGAMRFLTSSWNTCPRWEINRLQKFNFPQASSTPPKNLLAKQ